MQRHYMFQEVPRLCVTAGQKDARGPYHSLFSVFSSSFPEVLAVDLSQRKATEQAGFWSDSTEPVLCCYDSKQPQRVQATVIQSCFISG